MAVENIRAKNLQQQDWAAEECAQHASAYLEHAALATQVRLRVRFRDRVRVGGRGRGRGRVEGAYLEHAALATQAAKAAARMRWWERFRAGALAPGQNTLQGLKQSGALKTAEEALRTARARRIVEMTGIRVEGGGGAGEAGGADGLEMVRESADGAIPTPAACGAAVRISLTAARLQGGLRALQDLEDSNKRTGSSVALERQLTAQRTHL